MSSDRPRPTLADYVALAISPALIMGMVASLVFFLVNVLYVGEYVGRLQWILFFFVFGAVLIARMSLMGATADRAAIYGAPLGILTWIGLGKFVEYPDQGGIKELSWLINGGLIALVWWSAHRLTVDCTDVDAKNDDDSASDAEGLLQAVGLDEDFPKEDGKNPKKKRPLGLWVVYFSLAALPLFGLGQALIDADDAERRRTSFWLLIVYLGCGLGLLLTTCFLGLRRYLRQRNLKMPAAMTGMWLAAGGGLIVALLVGGAVLPRPEAEYSLMQLLPAKSKKLAASKFALKGDRAGKDNPGGKKGESDSRGKDGEGGKSDKDAKNSAQGKGDQSSKSGDKQNQSGGKNRSQNNSDQKGNKGDAKSGRDRTAQKDEQKSTDNKNDRSSSQSSSSTMSNVVRRLGSILKWIVFAVLAVVVLIYLLRSAANFSDWARRLLEALRNFWANLFGGRERRTAGESGPMEEEPVDTSRPFAEFANPFAGGRRGMAVPELVRYTFAAAQAWARERDLGRQIGETPLEFAGRVGREVPGLEAELHRVALLYARAVYSRGALPSNSEEVLRQFWRRLEAVVEQPLSA